MGICIFCSAQARLSREHIWADWLKAYIAKDMSEYTSGTITINRPGTPHTEKSKKISGDPRSRRARCVCKKCNETWMSALQERAKPIVVPMLHNERIRLSSKDQKALAAWVAMAVICSEYSARTHVSIRKEDRDILHKYKVPPSNNWRIFVGRYQRMANTAHWAHRTLLIVPDKEVDDAAFAASPTYNTQSSTYTVGEIFIHAISSSWSKCVRRHRIFPTGLVSEIWPVRSTEINWPPASILTDIQAAQISSGFFDGLVRAGTRR